jgi:LPS-assembly protein
MPTAAKRAMLASAALALLAHAADAQAQTQATAPQAPAPAAPAATSPDGLAPDELYMEADRLIRDDKAKITTAEGNVQIRYQGRTLRADRVVYDEGPDGQPGVIHGYGHVQIINSDGSVEYADDFIFDDKMSAGVARRFAARLKDNAKIAAATAVRRSQTIQELNRAIYTPCEICNAKGESKKPTWSISADRVVQDKKRRLIFYRNAKIYIKGVPVLYLPVFWHADPTADRASGLLTPSVGYSARRGLSYEQPYLWTASPSMDVVISPQINTQVNPLVNAQIRKRFYSGDVDLRFGYTYDRDIDGHGHKFGDSTSRSYVLGRGAFQVTDDWLLGFTAERASDRLIFDKYDIPKAFISRGPYVADDRRLISQAYAIRQDRESYFSVAAMSIQGLRANIANPTQLENNRVFPVIAPLVEERYDPQADVLGGRLRLTGSAVALTRDESPDNPALPGVDSRRVTGQADWRRSFIYASGLRVDPFVSVRADEYSLSDVPRTVGTGVHDLNVTRGLATAGADISYPLYRRWRDATVVLEPLAQVAVSPKAKQVVVGRDAAGDPIYLDEDSAAFEFDETNLFSTDKFPGYDLYEDGARLNVAGRGSVLWDDGRRASLLVGRSFRSKPNDIFTEVSGLRSRASDWILAADAEPIRGLSFFARARLDSDDFRVHRLEAGANVGTKWGSGFVRYLRNDAEITGLPANSLSGGKLENMDVGGEIYLGPNAHWGVEFYGNRDFTQDAWVVRDVGVFYRDDCVRVDVIFRREDTVIGRLGPSNVVSVRLTLATLGR